MAHRIAAVILRGSYNGTVAQRHDLRAIDLGQSLTLFPLDPAYLLHWGQRSGVGIHYMSERPRVDCTALHRIMAELTDEPLFAVIETDYLSGSGDQAAVVYCGTNPVMAAQVGPRGPINEALRTLGLKSAEGLDEFATAGLDAYPDFDDLFGSYHDA